MYSRMEELHWSCQTWYKDELAVAYHFGIRSKTFQYRKFRRVGRELIPEKTGVPTDPGLEFGIGDD